MRPPLSLLELQNKYFALLKPAAPQDGPWSTYQKAYRIRMENSLREDFPQTESFLGKEEFSEVIFTFLNKISSKTWTLSEFSQEFVNFLKENANPQMQNATLTAQKEWMHIQVRNESFAPLLDPAHIDYSAITVQLANTCRLWSHPELGESLLIRKVSGLARQSEEIKISAEDYVWLQSFIEPQNFLQLSEKPERLNDLQRALGARTLLLCNL